MVAFRPGRLAPHPELTHPRLHLGRHVTATLAAPPPAVDWHTLIDTWPMYGNDQDGDCVPAEMGHHEQAWTAYGAGHLVVVPDSAVLKVYEDVAGYVPGDPSTDNGTNVQDAMGYWRKTGIAGHRIAAFASVNVSDLELVKTALARFGPLSIGINLPKSAMDQFNNGQPWDTVTDDGGQLGGHCVAVVGYDGDVFDVVTWGAVQKMTAAFWRAYVEESWAPLSKEWLSSSGEDPEGVDLFGLGEEFAQLTGGPNPFPKPAPPSPTPPPAPGPDPLHELAVMVRHAIASVEAWLSKHGL